MLPLFCYWPARLVREKSSFWQSGLKKFKFFLLTVRTLEMKKSLLIINVNGWYILKNVFSECHLKLKWDKKKHELIVISFLQWKQPERQLLHDLIWDEKCSFINMQVLLLLFGILFFCVQFAACVSVRLVNRVKSSSFLLNLPPEEALLF